MTNHEEMTDVPKIGRNYADISAGSLEALMSQGCSAHSAVRLTLQFERVRLGSSSAIRRVSIVDAAWCYTCDRPKTDCGCVENGGNY